MELTRFPGAALVTAGGHRILFGSFPEIHQHLMDQKLGWPDALVFSDALLRDRLPQMVPEFLFFGHVFFNQNFDWATLSVKQPLTFIGTPSQVDRAARIMEVSLLGMTPEVMAHDLDPERAAFLHRETEYFALKDSHGKVLPAEAFLARLHWDEADTVQFHDVTISRTGMLRYRVEHEGQVEEIDLAGVGRQGPAWTIPAIEEVRTTQQYSLRILGAAGAFQAVAPSTSYLLTLNGDHYLIDCSPYVHRTLGQLGIAPEQIRSILISHVHDDHTGDLLAFAAARTRPEIVTTREVWAGLSLKLMALLDTDAATLDTLFRFREIVPGEPLYLSGARLDFHDACHSVPCVGVTLRVGTDELVITSDTAGHRQLLDMLGKGVISQERCDRLEHLLDGQKVIVDCGEAIIHGYVQDFLHRENNDNLVLAHRHTLPPEFQERFTLAQPLQFFQLGPQDEAVLDTVAIARALDAWSPSDHYSWTSLFAHHRQLVEPHAGEVILREGAPATDADFFYIITHGLYDVRVGNERVAQLRAGDWFGEQAFANSAGKRTASVVASTPGRLLAIPGTLLQDMLREEDRRAVAEGRETLTDRILRLWVNRDVVSRARVFTGLDVQALNAFALRLERIEVGSDAVVLQRGHRDDSACYLVVKGRLAVEKPDENEPPILAEHDLFGEGLAAGFSEVRTATVRALEPCTLLKLSQGALRSLGDQHPEVLFALRDLATQRRLIPAS